MMKCLKCNVLMKRVKGNCVDDVDDYKEEIEMQGELDGWQCPECNYILLEA